MKFSWLLFKSLREALFPPVCLKCRKIYRIPNGVYKDACVLYSNPNADLGETVYFRLLISAYLCPQCRSGFRPVKAPICSRCGIMFKSRAGGDHVCGKCLQSDIYFRKARAFAVYNELFKDVCFFSFLCFQAVLGTG